MHVSLHAGHCALNASFMHMLHTCKSVQHAMQGGFVVVACGTVTVQLSLSVGVVACLWGWLSVRRSSGICCLNVCFPLK